MIEADEEAVLKNLKNMKALFIFRGNDLALKENDSLPESNEFYDYYMELKNKDQIKDLFYEKEYSYAVMHIKENADFKSNWKKSTVREFFWISKTEEEKKSACPSEKGSLCARAHGISCFHLKYKFCPSCSAPLKDDKKFTAKLCLSCSNLFFPRIEPAIIVLVKKGDEILLEQNIKDRTSLWTCVAGFVETGETLENAVAREVKEETGIEIKNIQYKGSQSWPFPDQLMVAFSAEYKSGKIKIQEEEIREARWFKKDSLPEIPKAGSVAFNLITGKL